MPDHLINADRGWGWKAISEHRSHRNRRIDEGGSQSKSNNKTTQEIVSHSQLQLPLHGFVKSQKA